MFDFGLRAILCSHIKQCLHHRAPRSIIPSVPSVVTTGRLCPSDRSQTASSPLAVSPSASQAYGCYSIRKTVQSSSVMWAQLRFLREVVIQMEHFFSGRHFTTISGDEIKKGDIQSPTNAGVVESPPLSQGNNLACLFSTCGAVSRDL